MMGRDDRQQEWVGFTDDHISGHPLTLEITAAGSRKGNDVHQTSGRNPFRETSMPHAVNRHPITLLNPFTYEVFVRGTIRLSADDVNVKFVVKTLA